MTDLVGDPDAEIQHELLGCQVRVRLTDAGVEPPQWVEGKLIKLLAGGDAVVDIGEGVVVYAWPALEIIHQPDEYEKLADEIDAAAELTSERLAGGELERRRDAIMRQVRSGPDAEPQDVHEHPEAAPPVQAVGE